MLLLVYATLADYCCTHLQTMHVLWLIQCVCICCQVDMCNECDRVMSQTRVQGVGSSAFSVAPCTTRQRCVAVAWCVAVTLMLTLWVDPSHSKLGASLSHCETCILGSADCASLLRNVSASGMFMYCLAYCARAIANGGCRHVLHQQLVRDAAGYSAIGGESRNVNRRCTAVHVSSQAGSD